MRIIFERQENIIHVEMEFYVERETKGSFKLVAFPKMTASVCLTYEYVLSCLNLAFLPRSSAWPTWSYSILFSNQGSKVGVPKVLCGPPVVHELQLGGPWW